MEATNGWRSRITAAKSQAATPNDVISEISTLLMEHSQVGTLSITQLLKIRDLASNRNRLLSALQWL